MNPKLLAMLTAVGVVTAGGVGFILYTPQPSTRSMLELRDAGIAAAAGQRVVLRGPELITPQTRRRINAKQPGFLRPRQKYVQVARVAVCFNPDAGNCLRPTDGALRVGDLEAALVVPSLRRNLDGIDEDAGVGADDGGESDDVDDALQYSLSQHVIERCSTFDAGVAFTNAFCGTLNRLVAVPPECVIPDCWRLPDAGWDPDAVVDCRYQTTGIPGIPDNIAWRGCNVMSASKAVGTACVPVTCGTVGGGSLEAL